MERPVIEFCPFHAGIPFMAEGRTRERLQAVSVTQPRRASQSYAVEALHRETRHQCHTYPLPFIQKDSHVATLHAVRHRVRHSPRSCERCRSVFCRLYHPSGIGSAGLPRCTESPHPVNMRIIPARTKHFMYRLPMDVLILPRRSDYPSLSGRNFLSPVEFQRWSTHLFSISQVSGR